MTAQPRITLRSGPLRLMLAPALGGCIAGFEWTDGGSAQPILRPCPDPLDKVLDAACFPLVPYVNRIRGGAFTFRGREVRIAPNMPGDPSPLHGQGWLGPWQVEAAGERAATLSFSHEPGEWPWAYEARQAFALDDRRLTVELTCRNTSGEPMPCGLGQHPYFPCGQETVLDTPVTDAWTIDEHVLPVEKVPAEGRFDLRRRRACGQGLDHGFGGWGGLAWMNDPAWPFEVILSSTKAAFFQLYSPAEGGIFVAEPVTHANAALNAPEDEWPELGMRVLAPGETLALDMRLEVVPK
jgi:aldose 1-epimerase